VVIFLKSWNFVGQQNRQGGDIQLQRGAPLPQQPCFGYQLTPRSSCLRRSFEGTVDTHFSSGFRTACVTEIVFYDSVIVGGRGWPLLSFMVNGIGTVLGRKATSFALGINPSIFTQYKDSQSLEIRHYL